MTRLPKAIPTSSPSAMSRPAVSPGRLSFDAMNPTVSFPSFSVTSIPASSIITALSESKRIVLIPFCCGRSLCAASGIAVAARMTASARTLVLNMIVSFRYMFPWVCDNIVKKIRRS